MCATYISYILPSALHNRIMRISLNISNWQRENTLLWMWCKYTMTTTAWEVHRLLLMSQHPGKKLLRAIDADAITCGRNICGRYIQLFRSLPLSKLGSARGASAARLRYLITLPNLQIKYIINTSLFVFEALFTRFILIHHFMIFWNRSVRAIEVNAF